MSAEMDSSSPRSPLDEGEIEDDESKEFDDGFDENLMGDEEDRKKLAQMTEKEREQELFNRSERRETLKIRFEIERKLKSKAKKRELEKKQSKQVRARKRLRASEIYSSDESSEESDEYTPEVNAHNKTTSVSETTTPGKQTSKMNTRSGLLITSSSSSSASPSSASSSSDSEPEHDELEADEDGNIQQDNFQMSLADLRSLQLKREKIEKWVYAPFFKETAIGLFVKISVGNHPSNPDVHMYKVAQIVDITKGSRIYAINPLLGKHRTDRQCLVKIGRVERTYAMSFVSNRTFDEDDFARWKDQIHIDGQEVPSREYFNKKKRDLHHAVNYQYKDKDIEYEVNERSRFRELKECNFALKKTELMGEKADAEASNDYERAREIQQIIDELEEKAKELEKTRSSSTFSAISFVNERNRIKNIVESERVLKETKSIKSEDPFTRRKCTPTIVHNKNNGDSNSSLKQTDKNGENTMKPPNINNGNSLYTTKTLNGNNNSLTPTESVKSVDDLFQAHASIDLELDIDI